MASRFLGIPAEIREQVYRDLLSSSNARRPSGLPDGSIIYEFQLSILLTNRQIHREAKKIFQDNIFIKITTPWPEALGHISTEGRVPIVAAGNNAANFQNWHLWVLVDAPPAAVEHDRFSMIISLEDLNRFTKTWRYSNLNHLGLNTYLRLKLTIQDPHVSSRKLPKALQNQLLLPFGDVKGLQSCSVLGDKVLPSVKECLSEVQAIPEPTLEECLEGASSLKQDGDMALLAGDYDKALQCYMDAFAAIHIRNDGRVRHVYADGYYIREVDKGKYKGERGDYIRMMIRVELVAQIVLAYLKMENWTEAHFWGKRTIVLFRQGMTSSLSQEIADYAPSDWAADAAMMLIPAKKEMGEIFYRTALASRALGKTADVKTLIKAAAIYLPDDQAVLAERRALDD